MNPLNFLWQKSVDFIHAVSLILNTILVLEYTFMLLFGIKLFGRNVLEWLVLQQRMLPSEMSCCICCTFGTLHMGFVSIFVFFTM